MIHGDPYTIDAAGTKTIMDVTISTDAWAAVTDSEIPAAGLNYYADVAVTNLAAGDSVRVDFAVTSLAAVKAAGVSTGADVLAGKVRCYAASVPESALSARLTIKKA